MSTTESTASRHTAGFVIGLGLMLSMGAFPLEATLPNLPAIASDLGADARLTQLIVSVTILGFALSQIPIGLLADRFGRRVVLLGSTCVYLVGAIASSLAESIEVLLAARFLLGLGATAGPVVARAIIRDVTTPAEGIRLLSAGLALATSALIFTPLTSSIILHFTGWRGSLLLIVTHGAVILGYAWLALSETATSDHRHYSPWQQFKRSVRLYVGCGKSLFATVTMAVSFGGFFAFVTSVSTLVIDVYQLSPGYYAMLYTLPMCAVTGAAMIVRKSVARWPRASMVHLAIALVAGSGVVLAVCSLWPTPSLPLLWAILTLYAFGYGLVMPLMISITLEPLPEVAGFVSSIMGTVQFGMGTLISTLAAFFYAGTTQTMTVLMSVMAALCTLFFLTTRKVMLAH
ncbi:MAG: MFS transporter [Gammaproteobacteria bacterium]|nr:MFS transporter [Gammaproteobacteria bacterium]